MPVPDSIRTLCETFRLHREHYTSGGYNETELRREFLDPFFTALGWDVDNKAGYADAYKDVIHEDAIRIGGYTKAPDYCFRIGGTRKFFVEAKKPSVNIDGDIAPAYQVRRYGWSAKLPLCILSDFEEFAVYDTRVKPEKTDRPAKARTLYYTFDQYVEKWDEIAQIFSRDSILRGSFDKYADTAKGKRGTGAVDDTFLAEIERWRELLARNLALRNPALSVRDLNYAVQKIIDRIIFLRICEDRGTEDYGRLQVLLNGERTYTRLQQLFHQADARYNSGLFHFDNGEKGRSDAPDTLTTHLEIDDKTLKDILKNLYYPDSPYEFSVLPADILGQVYEQFLGKTIRLTDGHQAKIEEKPEVRKAGGVYYTPSYIVDYIVQNTLGRLLDGDDPEKPNPVAIAKAAEIKVLDPACGSGSFLIVAYQYLLGWHLRQYTADPATGELDLEKARRNAAGKAPKIYQAAGDTWRLTTAERKRILLNSIHGVDIDSQAVEVTKLSLLLKVLEGETQQQLQRDFLSERQRILPDLGGNIKCGNSLIGPDFYENEQMLLLDDESQYRINVFDWKKSFPDIMQRGGFDCVIGNPPYGIPFSGEEVSYITNRYSQVGKLIDSYNIFMIAAHKLTIPCGIFAYIVPNTFCDLENGSVFRNWLLTSVKLEKLRQTGWVFSQAVVDTIVFIARATIPNFEAKVIVELPNDRFEVKLESFREAKLHKIDFRNRPENHQLIERVFKFALPLSELLSVKAGVKLYEQGKGVPPQTPDAIKNRVFTTKQNRPDGWLPLLRGGNIRRYTLSAADEFVNYGLWLAAPRKPEMFKEPKLLMRRTDDRLLTAYDDSGMICVNSCHIIQHANGDSRYNYFYFMGLLNSRLMQNLFEISNPQMVGKVFAEIKVIYVERLPIRRIDFDNPADVALHDKMVLLVERMQDLNKKKAAEKNPNILDQLETQISATDRQIDRLVYQLYNLTPEEIAIVEGGKG